MKPHILFSLDDTSSGGSSDPVKRLSERYNIPEKDVQALLYGSRAPKPESGGSTKEKIMPQERPNFDPPRRESGWSTANILSLIVGILGIMALGIILIAVLKDRRHDFPHYGMNVPPPAPIMPAPNPPQPAVDTSKNQTSSMNPPPEIAPPMLRNELEPKPTGRKIRHGTRESSGGFTTSNSIEAQEHLAELRADGNTKAKIRQMKKNGVTIYSVK